LKRLRLRRGESGQASIELALVLPLFVLLVFGVAELSQAYQQAITVTASVREGIRVAGALANGGGTLGCGFGQSPNAATVDPQIVASIERVLAASGTNVNLSDVQAIRIYKSDANGNEVSANQWVYAAGSGPPVDGKPIDFTQSANAWPACSRVNTVPADSVGIRVSYTYRGRTPLRWLIPYLATIQINDRGVMALNVAR
jgi:hypothetical protein